jgi:hypothetical protein
MPGQNYIQFKIIYHGRSLTPGNIMDNCIEKNPLGMSPKVLLLNA